MQPQQTSPIEETKEKPRDTKTRVVIAAPEIYEESQVFGSDRSTLTEDSMRPAIEKDSPEWSDKFEKLSTCSFSASLLNKKTKKKGNGTKNYDSMSQNTAFLQESPFRKSNLMGASNMLRNFISCGTVDTNDAVLVPTNRDNKAFSDQPTLALYTAAFFMPNSI